MTEMTMKEVLSPSERSRAARISFDPMSAPVTLDTICLLSLALRMVADERSQAWKENYELKVENARLREPSHV